MHLHGPSTTQAEACCQGQVVVQQATCRPFLVADDAQAVYGHQDAPYEHRVAHGERLRLSSQPTFFVGFRWGHTPPFDVGVEVTCEEVLGVGLRRVAHLCVELNSRGKTEHLLAGGAVDPARGTPGLGFRWEGEEVPVGFHVVVEGRAGLVVVQGLPHHALLHDDVPGLVGARGPFEVRHVKHDVDAL